MATLLTWQVPTAPNSYPFYVRSVTPERGGRFYYTKYIVDTIGEIDIAGSQIIEWVVPGTVSQRGVLGGAALGPNNTVWTALQHDGILLELSPRNNLLTYFQGHSRVPGVPGGDTYPFSLVTKVRFDTLNRVWYIGTGATGYGVDGPLIGCFDRSKGLASYWMLPNIPLVSPRDLFIEDGGKVVWMTLYNTQPFAFFAVPFLARINTTSGAFDLWHRNIPRLPAGYAGACGLIADKPKSPKTLWLSYGDGQLQQQVLRFDLVSGVFIDAPHHQPTAQQYFGIDNSGTVWLSDSAGYISNLDPNCSGSGSDFLFRKTSGKLECINMKVRVRETPVALKKYKVNPVVTKVKPARNGCFKDYALPGLYALDFEMDSWGQPVMYFAQNSSDIVGQLIV